MLFFLLLRDIGDVVLDRVSNNLNIEEQASEDIFQGSHASFAGYTGPAEVGVPGVPGHTQYLLTHLVKIKLWPEMFGLMY